MQWPVLQIEVTCSQAVTCPSQCTASFLQVARLRRRRQKHPTLGCCAYCIMYMGPQCKADLNHDAMFSMIFKRMLYDYIQTYYHNMVLKIKTILKLHFSSDMVTPNFCTEKIFFGFSRCKIWVTITHLSTLGIYKIPCQFSHPFHGMVTLTFVNLV